MSTLEDMRFRCRRKILKIHGKKTVFFSARKSVRAQKDEKKYWPARENTLNGKIAKKKSVF